MEWAVILRVAVMKCLRLCVTNEGNYAALVTCVEKKRAGKLKWFGQTSRTVNRWHHQKCSHSPRALLSCVYGNLIITTCRLLWGTLWRQNVMSFIFLPKVFSLIIILSMCTCRSNEVMLLSYIGDASLWQLTFQQMVTYMYPVWAAFLLKVKNTFKLDTNR